MASLLLLYSLSLTASALDLTLRSQHLSQIGRKEWKVDEKVVQWDPAEIGIVVVDMWNQHWCESATARVAEIAVPMNQTLTAARADGIQIVFAPSDVFVHYDGTPSREWVKALPNATVPQSHSLPQPPMPLSTATNGGCDVRDPQGSPWTHQIDTLHIDQGKDAIISSVEGEAEQELFNVITARKLKKLIYLGVHENMCILGRPFAIEKVTSWGGWDKSNLAVVRDLVDVMYTPEDSPYVSHAEGLRLHTSYVEKFWASSLSMYDILRLGTA
eukprot:g556.t1